MRRPCGSNASHTRRRPKRQLVGTVHCCLQRIDEPAVEELVDLNDVTRGMLQTAKESAESENRRASSAERQSKLEPE